MVLLHAHLPHGKAGTPQGPEQLVTAVNQPLQPRSRRCAHGEHTALQGQGAAMGRQLSTSQAGPGLPEGGQVTLPLPPLLEMVQTGGEPNGRSRRRRQQQGDVSNHALLQTTLLA